MGCHVSTKQEKYEEKNDFELEFTNLSPEEKRERCQLRNKTEGVFLRNPGSISGQHFSIQDCSNCTIALMDYMDSVSADCLKKCNIFIGPTSGSVFLRDCENCNIVVACRQFRTRNVNNSNISLYCNTQPIIEESHHNPLTCFYAYYSDLYTHFQCANLDPLINNWSNIYDFTPSDNSVNILPPQINEIYNSTEHLFFSSHFVIPLENNLPPNVSASDITPAIFSSLVVPLSYGMTTYTTGSSNHQRIVLLFSFPFLPKKFTMKKPASSSSSSFVKACNNNKENQTDFMFLLSLLVSDLKCITLRTKRITQPINNELKQGLKKDKAPPSCFNITSSGGGGGGSGEGGGDECVAAFLLVVEDAFGAFPSLFASKVLPKFQNRYYLSPSPESANRDMVLIPP